MHPVITGTDDKSPASSCGVRYRILVTSGLGWAGYSTCTHYTGSRLRNNNNHHHTFMLPSRHCSVRRRFVRACSRELQVHPGRAEIITSHFNGTPSKDSRAILLRVHGNDILSQNLSRGPRSASLHASAARSFCSWPSQTRIRPARRGYKAGSPTTGFGTCVHVPWPWCTAVCNA